MLKAEYWAVVRNQPETLRTSIAAARASLAASALPTWEAGQVLATIGMGASTFAAIAKSFSVRPPAEWVVNATTTFPHPTRRSGWWSSASATAPTRLAKARAALKSGKA